MSNLTSNYEDDLAACLRRQQGSHYTCEKYVMKMLKILFIDEYERHLRIAKTEIASKELALIYLKDIYNHIGTTVIFDPACGTGNFLLIGLRELRKIEQATIAAMKEIDPNVDTSRPVSRYQIYGIEYDKEARDLCVSYLVEAGIKEHVANKCIVHGNAARLDWEEICPLRANDNIVVVGNPPYKGSKFHNKEQRKDMDIVFKGFKRYKKLDYCAIWVKKTVDFIKYKPNVTAGLLTTTSIHQGEQAALLWGQMYDWEIFAAVKPFKWESDSVKSASVVCSMVFLRSMVTCD